MQYFKDTATGKSYAYEDDVVVSTNADGTYSFTAAHGVKLNAPATLEPHTPEQPIVNREIIASQLSAVRALAATDITMNRIIEAVSMERTGFAAPDVVEFMKYRQALRAIVTANVPMTLPVAPPFPAGT